MAKNKPNLQSIKQINSIKKIESEITQKLISERIIFEYSFGMFSLCLFLTGFCIFKDYLLGNAIYLFKDIGCDGLNVTYPNIVMISDYFKREGMPLWTFTQGNETTSRWVSGVPGNIMLLGITNVKYLLSNSPNNQVFKSMGLDSIQTIGNVKTLKNRFALPLGITYDSYTTEEDFIKAKSSAVFKSKAFIQACVVDKFLEKQLIGLNKITQIDTSFIFKTNNELPDLFNALKADFLKITKFSETNIIGNINLKTKKILYLSIPFDKGWHAVVNGKKVDLQRVQWGLTGLVLDKGNHKIDLAFTPPYRKEGTLVSIFSLGLFGVMLLISNRRKRKTILWEAN